MSAMHARYAMAAIVLLLYASLCVGLYWREVRRKLESDLARRAMQGAGGATDVITVVYASQTGYAEQLAWQTAKALRAGGTETRIAALAELDADALTKLDRALFVVATYGEGDAPDAASLFVRKIMSSSLDLSQLRFGLLALGDKTYANYCGFGRAVDAWLTANGGQPLFERVELDNSDPVALQRWREDVALLAEGPISDASSHAAWDAPAFESWTLAKREHLNRGSAGHPLYHLELTPPAAMTEWEAGDIAQILVPSDPDRPRDYSIASLPSDGALHLVVRKEIRADGSVGAGSGWLSEGLPLGGVLPLRVKPNRNFHLGANAFLPMILIGNGTGLAGLLSLLKARARLNQPMNWLIFGERNAAYDSLYAATLDAWFRQGHLTHLDRVFSRDQSERRYVQDILNENAKRLAAWVEEGASIYVCGSLEGMAAGVDDVLSRVLGREKLESLAAQGRYRRDVY